MTPEEINRALEAAEIAKDLSPKVRVLAAGVIGQVLDELCADGPLTYEQFTELRGRIVGARAFSRQLDRVIKSGEMLPD